MPLSAAEQNELEGLNNQLAEKPAGGLSADEQKELTGLNGRLGSPTGGILGTAKDVLGGTAKVLDYPASTITRPAIANLMQAAMPGKQIVKPGEYGQVNSPFNMQHYPGMGELMKRAGVPAGATLSSVVPGYAEPGPNNPWYRPEKGGMLDPTIRGTGGFLADVATDPVSYLSAGMNKILPKVGEATAEGISSAAREMGAPVRATEAATPRSPYPNVMPRPDETSVSMTGANGPAFQPNMPVTSAGTAIGPKVFKGGLPGHASETSLAMPPPGPATRASTDEAVRAADEGPREAGSKLSREDTNAQAATTNAKTLRDRADQALNPLTNLARGAGTWLYQKGAAPILQAARKAGKGDLTDFMMNDVGMRGTPQQMVDQLAAKKADLGKAMGTSLNAMDKAGATANVWDVIKPYTAKIQSMLNNGTLTSDQAEAAVKKALAPQMEYVAKNGPEIPLSTLHEWRQSLDNNLIPQAVWGEGATANKKMGNQLTLSLRQSMNDAIDEGATKALGPGAGDQFRTLNQQWGQVAAPKITKAAQGMADTAAKRPFLSPWDAAFLATGAGVGSEMGGHTLEGAIGGLAARKAVQATQSPWVLTNVGQKLNAAGSTPALMQPLEAAARRKFINLEKPEDNQ